MPGRGFITYRGYERKKTCSRFFRSDYSHGEVRLALFPLGICELRKILKHSKQGITPLVLQVPQIKHDRMRAKCMEALHRHHRDILAMQLTQGTARIDPMECDHQHIGL